MSQLSAAPARAGRPSRTVTRPALGCDLLLGVALAGLYGIVGYLSNARIGLARHNGRALLELEHHLGIDVEAAANRWLVTHPALATLASYEYAVTYVVTSFGLLFWLWWRRPDAYPAARTSFIALNLAAMVCFLLFPTAPPRLLPGTGFVDSVAQARPPGSWGSGLVSAFADRVGAMPSLHVAWAVWFFVVLAAVTASRRLAVLSGLHVAVTVVVIVVTANHYLLDAVAGAALAAACTLPAGLRAPFDRWTQVAPNDAFFLRVEDTGVPQTIGGVAPAPAGRDLDLDGLRASVAAGLPMLPLLRRRFRWDRYRVAYRSVAEVDISWHVIQVRLPAAGAAAVDDAVAALLRQRLPRDRPPWRLVLLREPHGRCVAFAFVLHHALADGPAAVAVIADALRGQGRTPLRGQRPAPIRQRRTRPSRRATRARLRDGGDTVAGLVRLAAAGRAPRHPYRRRGAPGTGYARATVPMAQLRLAARRQRVAVTDVVVAAAIAAIAPAAAGSRLRVAVPAARRDAAHRREVGATLVDVPLGEPLETLVVAVARERTSDHRGGEVRAGAAVLRVVGWLPGRVSARFARHVYGWRYFNAIVSVFPGAGGALQIDGRAVPVAHPVLPLAAGVPVSLGAMAWGAELALAVTTDPEVLDAEAVVAATAAGIATLAAEPDREPVS